MTLDLDTLVLRSGTHTSPSDGVSLMEAVSDFAGEPWSNSPSCTSPVIAAYARSLNDWLPDDERQRLKAYIPRLVGTAEPDLELRRAFACADAAVRVFAPLALKAAGLVEEAAKLGAHAPVNRESAEAARSAAESAESAARSAASLSAWSAAESMRSAAESARSAARSASSAARSAESAQAESAAESARSAESAQAAARSAARAAGAGRPGEVGLSSAMAEVRQWAAEPDTDAAPGRQPRRRRVRWAARRCPAQRLVGRGCPQPTARPPWQPDEPLPGPSASLERWSEAF